MAKTTRVPPRRINEIVHGMRAVTADTALRLSRYFGTTPEFWLNLQVLCDLARTRDRVMKVDIFVLGSDPYSREAFCRRRREPLSGGGPAFFLPGPEDVILRKLEWYRKGGEVSERQWADVSGVLRVSGAILDGTYLDRWARELGVADLLDRARREIGPT